MTGQRERRRRRRWSADEKRALVQQWKASGLSARDFAAQEGLPSSNLSRWSSPRRGGAGLEARRSEKPSGTISFAPVQAAETGAVSRGDEASARVQLEVVLGIGARVRVFDGADARMVSELVLAVAGRA